MKKILFLDDIRSPFDGNNWVERFSPIEKPYDVIWVKTYKEFTEWININGLPDAVLYDHDLSDFQAMKSGYPELMEDAPWTEDEKTGMDCAKWLVEYCMDNNLKLPLYGIQSSNPVGKENIDQLLKNFNNKYAR